MTVAIHVGFGVELRNARAQAQSNARHCNGIRLIACHDAYCAREQRAFLYEWSLICEGMVLTLHRSLSSL